MYTKLAALSALLAVAKAQQVCTLTAEKHPSMTWKKCTSAGNCANQNGQVTIDANWRWTHSVSGSTNCYTGNKWDASLCPDNETCAKNCCLDGAEYAATYGASTSGDALSLGFVTKGQGTNVGSRLYLMNSETKYEMFKLAGNEFTFDVDTSQLGCGLNGALYFVSMDADGGTAKDGNKAGAKYGTGYCDSQCPRDLKYIAGKANVEGWISSTVSANSGVGNVGACCAEMDIWEANSISQALTPHPCEVSGLTTCKGASCGGAYSDDRYAGTCDPDGCDWNPYRLGSTKFYGPGSGFTLDTKKKVTVVTQFPASGSKVTAIRRFYVQDGVRYEQPKALNLPGITGNEINEAFCNAEEAEFGGDSFNDKGGLSQMSDALSGEMVLVMSIWDDYGVNMLWLDSVWPAGSTEPGAARGTCSPDSGKPADVERDFANAKVTYSNIRFGPIGSTTTFNTPGKDEPGTGVSSSSTRGGVTSTTSRATTSRATTTMQTTTRNDNSPTQTKYGQCGGSSYAGPTACAGGSSCQKLNDWYSQCL